MVCKHKILMFYNLPKLSPWISLVRGYSDIKRNLLFFFTSTIFFRTQSKSCFHQLPSLQPSGKSHFLKLSFSLSAVTKAIKWEDVPGLINTLVVQKLILVMRGNYSPYWGTVRWNKPSINLLKTLPFPGSLKTVFYDEESTWPNTTGESLCFVP